MRLAVLIAVSMLVAACSQSVGGEAAPSGTPTASSPDRTGPTSAVPAPSVPPPAGAAPRQGTPIGEVIDWIEAGTPADPADFHVAFRDGVTTRLGDDVAFTAPTGAPHDTVKCITAAIYNDGAPTCLLNLDSPAPRPTGTEGVWKPGWVEYTGDGLVVGALHGDPGPFVDGAGPELAPGQTIAFGDYRCRSDTTGLACVNYAHRSAVWMGAGGILTYGCLQPVPAPPYAGATFGC